MTSKTTRRKMKPERWFALVQRHDGAMCGLPHPFRAGIKAELDKYREGDRVAYRIARVIITEVKP